MPRVLETEQHAEAPQRTGVEALALQMQKCRSPWSTEGAGPGWADWGFPREPYPGRGAQGGQRRQRAACAQGQTLFCVCLPAAARPPLCRLWKERAGPRAETPVNAFQLGSKNEWA